MWFFFFQAEDGIRDLVRSRGLGDVYKRQGFVGADKLDGGADDDTLTLAATSASLNAAADADLSLIHI